MDIGSILWTLIIGLIVGVIARFLMPGKENLPAGFLGWILTALIGIAGAFIGKFIATTFWAGEGYVVGWVMSIIGAILLLIVVRLIFGRGGTTA